MLTKEFWGILFIVFVGWVLIAGQPTKRIDRACAPVEWTGNLSTSLAALVVPQYQTNLKQWFDKMDYGCEYLVWRLLYQDDWNKFQATRAAQGTDATGVQAAPDEQKQPADDGTAPVRKKDSAAAESSAAKQ